MSMQPQERMARYRLSVLELAEGRAHRHGPNRSGGRVPVRWLVSSLRLRMLSPCPEVRRRLTPITPHWEGAPGRGRRYTLEGSGGGSAEDGKERG
jgi:hypothetical protein